jgi:hypothetical protein
MSVNEQPGDLRDRSTADLVKGVTELVPRLVREEMALAKAEVTEKGKHAGVGAGLLGGGGLFAYFGLAVLIAAAVLGLSEAVEPWLAAVIVAVVLFVIAGILALVGKGQLKRGMPPVPAQAVDSTKQDVQAVKESAKR